ncbi:YncE incomplete domain containing protein [Pandoravirus neocaledonia]|uniref:YncE incomplete domain containing protein n=1 Tax=Pandoravirus neocaledonia TaxID=2107708 RepID=A0A2U7UBG2_9VIRU|nr:YncE incomplete domain containing protein [Pandoravirus neocaledonia]AVK75776.1 YncE incomplete domain containing protein [Pandoravirus neocaledonia]
MDRESGAAPLCSLMAPAAGPDRDTNNDWVLLVVEEMAGTASFYRASDGVCLGSVEVGLLPHEVRATRDGATAFVSAFGLHDYDSPLGRPGATVAEIDVATMTVRRRLRTFAPGAPLAAADRAPHGVELSPDEQTLYVNCEHADPTNGVSPSILAYDLSASAPCQSHSGIVTVKTFGICKGGGGDDGGIGASCSTGPVRSAPIDHRCAQAHHLVASPDGRVLWMMSGPQGLGAIDVVTGKALSDGAVLAPPPGAEALRGLCWSSGGGGGGGGCARDNDKDKRNDAVDGAAIADGTSSTQTHKPLLLASGRDTLATVDPAAPAWVDVWRGFGVGQLLYSTSTPDGALLLGPAVWNGIVIVVDAHTGKLVRRVPTGLAPIHVNASPDGRHAYVTNAYESFVTEIDLRSFAIRRIATRSGPNGLAILTPSAVPAAAEAPRARAAPDVDIVLRLTAAVDMTGTAVPGRRHDVGCEVLAGASMWARSIAGDGGILHLGAGSAVKMNTVVDYADLESDSTGAVLASVVREGAAYKVQVPSCRGREVRIVVAHGVGDTRAAVAEVRECGGSVILFVLEPTLAPGAVRRMGPWAWAVSADATHGGDQDALSHDRWVSRADFDDAYWDKFHERPAPVATVAAAGACCLIEAALTIAARSVGSMFGVADIDDALAGMSVHHGFCGTAKIAG